MSVARKIIIFVKKIKSSLSNYVMSKIFSTEKEKLNLLPLSRYEDQELNFVDDKPWILFLGEKKTQFIFNQNINKHKQGKKKNNTKKNK